MLASKDYLPEKERPVAWVQVEWYQIAGAPHGGARSIDGRDPFWIVFEFWLQVQKSVVLLTLSLHRYGYISTKGRGGCSRMTISPTSGCRWRRRPTWPVYDNR